MAVEAVIMIPVVMLVLMVMVRWSWAQKPQVARLAASEGARAAVSSGGGAAVGASRARAVLAASGSTSSPHTPRDSSFLVIGRV